MQADYKRIILSDLQPEDIEIIIPYHWMKYLVADSGVGVERMLLGDGPIGFIKTTNPPEKLTINNAY